ncbi:hypothetical protein L2E82_32409 [Cichorium intybus]|uniref:Uncharacterized protein n=1 Tax=Cichorium intybus TaxID=13427 RepID=A0ACB9BGC8_CICIN|nr:hypothetical protein L2E82_32409 [Cichorium intybus]
MSVCWILIGYKSLAGAGVGCLKDRCSYRTNYFILIVFILGLGFLSRPFAIVAVMLTALTITFLNDMKFSFTIAYGQLVYNFKNSDLLGHMVGDTQTFSLLLLSNSYESNHFKP